MHAIVINRLVNHGLSRAGHRRASDVVAWSGAVQAQEYTPAKWGLGIRMRAGTVDADIEAAFTRGEILRTHVLRPTWHFVAPADIRWLLALTAPRVQRIMARYNRRLDLSPHTMTRSFNVLEHALRDHQFMTRAELRERLASEGLAFSGVRLAQLMMHAELEAVVCSGPRRGKQFTYALLDERAPEAARLSRDEALAEIVRRYFRSHGPATIRDFVWWSGLTVADAKRGLDMTGATSTLADGLSYWSFGRAARAPAGGQACLLPIYDEYLIAYRDRVAVPHGPSAVLPASRWPVTFQHAIVIDGQVAGTWRWTSTARRTSIDAVLLGPARRTKKSAVADAVERFARFQGSPVHLTVTFDRPQASKHS
jgi:hypothetical protein